MSDLAGVSLPPTMGIAPKVSLDGMPLSDDVLDRIRLVEVESSLPYPDACTVEFVDPGCDLISDTAAQLGSTLKVQVSYGDEDGETIFDGEVTSLEASYDPFGRTTVIRGLDKSNRMTRGRKTKAYQEMTASDIVEQLASDNGVNVGETDPTSSTYTVASQANQSDWEYLQQLAYESGRVAYTSLGSLYFVKPPSTSSASVKLEVGANLTQLRAVVTAASQVSSVEVRSWDSANKQPISGVGSAGAASVSNDDDPSTIAGTFGGEKFVTTGLPSEEQSDIDTAAAALAERIGEGFVELEGEAILEPKLGAGVAFSIAGAGDPFDGKYVASSVTHIFGPDGYKTLFSVSGVRDASLGGLTSGPPVPYRRLVNGVLPATVSSVKDPTNSGLVQLTFPWLDADYVSDWCRVVQVGAGKSWGNILMPETNSEVLVAFEHGDIRKPYVIGGLYNGSDKIAPQSDVPLIDSGTGAINQRLIQSRTKHLLYFNDDAQSACILLQTGDTNHSLKFEQQGQGTVTLKSNGDITVQGNNITIKAQQNLDLEGQQGVTIKGSQVQVTADASLTVKSNGTAEISATGTMDIKGTMTSINA